MIFRKRPKPVSYAFRNPNYWRPLIQTIADNAIEIDSDRNTFRFSYPLDVQEAAANAAAAEYDEARAITVFSSILKAGAVPILLSAELRTT